ncbi:small ribosomal subunit protein uS7 isoform X1 [Melospiza melodia melodia]|uniref:small ribosomal subunit protein uS7 isoform X1 n=1 Tax=Melospiza melodia melodia TaxID=1914991 RepID=UPI002FCF2212
MTDWETAPAVTETPDIKLFGKWSTDDVQINDISLQDYIAVKEKYAKYLPHSAGRYAAKRFRKAQCPIVERLTNSMMMHGRNNGKKLMTVRIVKHALRSSICSLGRTPCRSWSTPSSTRGPARTRRESAAPAPCAGRPWTCPPCAGSTRPSGCCARALARPPSGTSKPSPSAWRTSSSTLPRAPPTLTPSRRRTSWSAWPNPTAKNPQKNQNIPNKI